MTHGALYQRLGQCLWCGGSLCNGETAMADELIPGRSHPAAVPAVATPPRRLRVLAWVALALLGLVVATVATLLVVSQGLLVLVVAGVSAAVVAIAATGWWAFTTRRPWKRRLNVSLAGIAAVAAVLVVALFSLRFAVAVVSLGVLTVGYVEAARRALAAAAAEVAGLLPSSVPVPPERPWLLVNPHSGGGKAVRVGLIEAARRRGVEVHVLTPGEDIQALATAAVTAGADAVGVAGGDGSLGAVAAVAVQHRLPFVCVPTGTRNHFAADLGLDRTRPLAALAALDGHERQVDVGMVNGRMFLNNVSIGAYAELVHESNYREHKLGTARTMLPEMLRTEQPTLDLRLHLPDRQLCADALVLLVANNPYGPGPLERAARPKLDTGQLQVSVLRARTGARIAAALTQLATPRAGENAWAEWTTPALRVESAADEIRAAVDGEAALLSAPLDFRASPGALRVLVPTGRRRARLADLVAPVRWSTVSTLLTVARTGRSR